jgi:hypothetical protein
MLAAWLVGLAVYQLVNPGDVGAWSDMWSHVAGWLHFQQQSWMSASLLSFLAAGIVAYVADLISGRRRGDETVTVP